MRLIGLIMDYFLNISSTFWEGLMPWSTLYLNGVIIITESQLAKNLKFAPSLVVRIKKERGMKKINKKQPRILVRLFWGKR